MPNDRIEYTQAIKDQSIQRWIILPDNFPKTGCPSCTSEKIDLYFGKNLGDDGRECLTFYGQCRQCGLRIEAPLIVQTKEKRGG